MKKKIRFYEICIKRPLDFICSLCGIILLSPILLILSVLVRIKLGKPVLFKQKRPGLNEKIFTLYKFRTMTNERDENGELLPDSKRLTKFGRFLRKSSLDELPELFNILLGDMSIVGPRPLSIHYLPFYSVEEKERQSVRPGLTGLAQINGRNNLQWDERLKYDLEYIEKVSLRTDINIILNTIKKVAQQSDIAVRGQGKVVDFSVYSVLREEAINVRKYEIGSYFHLTGQEQRLEKVEIPDWLNLGKDVSYTFSGRAAIEIAIKDIGYNKKVKSVYMPSYCCVSMIQPFLDNNINIEFYDIIYENGKITYKINENQDCDIFFAMNYFGMQNSEIDQYIQKFNEKGKIVIEDITHRLLDNTTACSYSNYIVASLRKWFAIPTGGIICKRGEKLYLKPNINGDSAVEGKVQAMKKKYAYLTGESGKKEEYLYENAKFDNQLIHMDYRTKIDTLSASIIQTLDIEKIKEQRKKNAALIYDGIKEIKNIRFLFPEPDLDRDVPLFVPIMLKKNDRNSLREYLIQSGIYCPIHWPEVMGTKTNMREHELSLICDQRYSEIEMRQLVEEIKNWYKSYNL